MVSVATGDGDELVVATADDVTAQDLLDAATAAGGLDTVIWPTTALALADGQTKALSLSVRVAADPSELPWAVAELLGAELVTTSLVAPAPGVRPGRVVVLGAGWTWLIAAVAAISFGLLLFFNVSSYLMQTRIQSLVDQARFLAQNAPRVGRMGKEVQSNVTDNDSAKMKSSHGIIQGYNANAMVDAKHQVIVHAQAFGEGDDGALAAPMFFAIVMLAGRALAPT